MKKCRNCGENKSFSEYSKHHSTRDGYTGSCRACNRETMHRNRAATLAKDPDFYRRRKSESYHRNKRLKGSYHPHFAKDEEWTFEEGRRRTYIAYKATVVWKKRIWSANARFYADDSIDGRRVTTEEWKQILDDYNWKCAYCGTEKRIGVDHKIPVGKGGKHLPENLVPACFPCNAKKAAKTYEEFVIYMERNGSS